MKKSFYISLILILSSSNIYSKGFGSSSVSTLLIPISARISSFGESCASLENDIILLNCNPAGIYNLTGWNTSLMYQRGYAEDNYMNLHIGKDYKNLVIATSILYYTTGEIELYKSDGTEVSEIGKREIVGSIGVAKNFWKFPVGLNIKLISSELFGEQANAYACDLGVQYRLKDCSSLGLIIRNIGTQIEYIEEGEDLPKIIQLGGNYTRDFNKYSLLILDDLAYYINEEEYLYMIGLEIGYNKQLFLRTGYKINLSETKNKSINLGIGFNYKKYSIDYSAEFNNNLNIPHRVSLGYAF